MRNAILAVTIILLTFFAGSTLAQDETLKISPEKPVIGSAQEDKDINADKNDVQVGDIYVACKYYFSKVFTTRESVSRKNICNGYFFGSASMLLLLQSEQVKTNTCIPMDISTEEIIRGFLDWTDNNQDKMKMLASGALLKILRENYPCNEYKPGVKKITKPKSEPLS